MIPGLSASDHEVRGRVPSTAQAAVVGGLMVVAYALLVLFGWPSKGVVASVTDVAFPLMSVVNVVLCALAVRRADGRLRVAWLVLLLGLASWATGELLWAYYERGLHEMPFPSWADVSYLASVPLVVLALLLVPSPGTWRDQGRLILDGLIITGSLLLISWITVMRTIWVTDGGRRGHFALELAYPAGDVLTLALGLLVLFRAPAGLRTAVGLLVAGLACSAAGNALWAYLGDPDGYKNGGVADIFFAANFVLIGVALLAACNAEPGAVAAAGPSGWLSLWLPLLPVAVAAVFVVTAKRDVVMEAPVVVAGTVLVVATLFRQFLESAELVRREHQIRHLADRLTGELDSASQYVASILPGELDGPVHVSSRYKAAEAVGGDSFGYEWIDDDHLIVYLIDVSGHGVKPALLSVSVHNLLRSGGLTRATLLAPDRVLAELNGRFGMDNHDEHYFTMWFGVYSRSTGLLRYANAGHPPPLVLTEGKVTAELAGASMPVGMFGDTEFTAHAYSVPPGARILLYSDGVLDDAPRMADFRGLCAEMVGDPSGELDDLIVRLPPSEDDCSLVLLTFPLAGVRAGAA